MAVSTSGGVVNIDSNEPTRDSIRNQEDQLPWIGSNPDLDDSEPPQTFIKAVIIFLISDGYNFVELCPDVRYLLLKYVCFVCRPKSLFVDSFPVLFVLELRN